MLSPQISLICIKVKCCNCTRPSILQFLIDQSTCLQIQVIRPNCSEKEVIIALYVCIIINCVIATILAIVYRSIYDLFVLCGDFMFVIVFPQLTLVLYWELANTYGSVVSFFIGLLLRLLCGDKTMGIPAAIEFGKIYAACPTDENPDKMCEGPMPFRLFVTIIGALVHVIIR